MRTQQPHSFTAQPISAKATAAKSTAALISVRMLRTTLAEQQPVLTSQSAMAQDRSAA